jgi:hypothetical protein
MRTFSVSLPSLGLPAFAALLLLGLSASAAAQPTVTLRGNVGASFFRAPDGVKNALNSGVDVGAGAGIRVWEGVSIIGHVSYDQFTLNEQTARSLGRAVAGDRSFLGGALGVRYTYLNETDAHPYASVGAGIYRLHESNRKVFRQGNVVERLPSQSATNVGLHLALGSLFRLDDTYALFFEPRYVFYDISERLTGAQRYASLRLGVEVQL